MRVRVPLRPGTHESKFLAARMKGHDASFVVFRLQTQ